MFVEADALAKKLDGFLPTAADRILLNELSGSRRKVAAGEEFGRDSLGEQSANVAYVIHKGWACVYKLLPDGNRQTIDFRLPGDFIGLVGLLLRRPDRHLEALTDAVISEINVNRLMATFHRSAALAEGLLWILSRDSAIMAEHIVNLGRRPALERTVHLLLELGFRLMQIGQATPSSFECPLTQKELAEALGITNVHLNRVLRTLRDDELLTFNGHTVVLHNVQVLARISGFDASYLLSAREKG